MVVKGRTNALVVGRGGKAKRPQLLKKDSVVERDCKGTGKKQPSIDEKDGRTGNLGEGRGKSNCSIYRRVLQRSFSRGQLEKKKKPRRNTYYYENREMGRMGVMSSI